MSMFVVYLYYFVNFYIFRYCLICVNKPTFKFILYKPILQSMNETIYIKNKIQLMKANSTLQNLLLNHFRFTWSQMSEF